MVTASSAQQARTEVRSRIATRRNARSCWSTTFVSSTQKICSRSAVFKILPTETRPVKQGLPTETPGGQTPVGGVCQRSLSLLTEAGLCAAAKVDCPLADNS